MAKQAMSFTRNIMLMAPVCVMFLAGCASDTDWTDLWRVTYADAVKSPSYEKILRITRQFGLPTSANDICLHTRGFQDVHKFLVFKAEKADIEKFGDLMEFHPDMNMKYRNWPSKPPGHLHTTMSSASRKSKTRFGKLLQNADQIKNGRYYEDHTGLYIAVDVDNNIVYLLHL